MRILVTGATGFIGRTLIQKLIDDNEVWGTTRCTNLNPDRRIPGCLYIPIDWDSEKSLEEAVRNKEIVFHLAGTITARFWSEYYHANVLSSVRLFSACRKEGVKRFVYLSSISAGGPVKKTKILDETIKPSPNGLYGLSKLKAEKKLQELANESLTKLYIIRCPVAYGRGQNSLLTKILQTALKGQVTVLGNGSNVRSLCYIENLIHAFERITKLQEAQPGLYYIADREVLSVNQFFEIIGQITGERITIKRLPSCLAFLSNMLYILLARLRLHSATLFVIKAMNSDLACRINKAQKYLSYEPPYSLQEGLLRTISWIRDQEDKVSKRPSSTKEIMTDAR